MTKVLALEMSRHGVRVNALAPGYFATAMNQDPSNKWGRGGGRLSCFNP